MLLTSSNRVSDSPDTVGICSRSLQKATIPAKSISHPILRCPVELFSRISGSQPLVDFRDYPQKQKQWGCPFAMGRSDKTLLQALQMPLGDAAPKNL